MSRSRDERVREQRRQRVAPRSGQRGLDREPLVGLRVRDEPEHLGRQRIDRQRVRAVAIDRAGDLDHVVVGEVGDRAVVRTFTTCTSPVPAWSDAIERRRRVAVERAAALLQQLRLRVQRRVLVQLEQARLDLHDLFGAGLPRRVAPRARPMSGSSSAGSSSGSRRGRGRGRAAPLDLVERSSGASAGSARSSGSRSTPSTSTLRSQRQMVEPDVLELHAVGRRRRSSDAKLPLESDRHVAQPERAMALIQQRLRHEPGRVREVDEPRPRRADARPLRSASSEHDGHGAQRLREPAGAGRLLPDAPELAAGSSRPV